MKGPDAATRNASQTRVWGEARDARGQQHEIRIITLDGYSLTVFSSLAIRRTPDIERCSSRLSDAGRVHGRKLHCELAWHVKARFVAPISVICGTGRSTL